MNFMEITNLWDLGYEMDKIENVFQDIKDLPIKDDYVVKSFI